MDDLEQEDKCRIREKDIWRYWRYRALGSEGSCPDLGKEELGTLWVALGG